MTTAPNPDPGREAHALEPVTGELIPLDAPTDTLAAAIERLEEYAGGIKACRQVIADELARRLDSANARSERVGDWVLETNPPTSEDYLVDVLEAELRALVDAGVLDPVILERAIKRPEPTPPEPKVDKREVNKLKKSADQRVLAAVAKARNVKANNRTIKIGRAAGAGAGQEA